MHCYESRTHVYIHCFLLTARTFNLDASSIIFLILGVLSGFSVQFFSTSFSRRRCTEFIFVQVLRRQKRKRTKESNLTPITFLPHTQHAHRETLDADIYFSSSNSKRLLYVSVVISLLPTYVGFYFLLF